MDGAQLQHRLSMTRPIDQWFLTFTSTPNP